MSVKRNTMTNEEIEKRLTPDEIEQVFRYQQMKYAIEDAKWHIEELVDWKDIPKEEADELYSYAEEMADRYLNKYADCSLPENAVWEELVRRYYEEKILPKHTIDMSFYHGTLNRAVLKEALKMKGKPIQYTYGLGYRNPTTNHEPITLEEALKIVDTQSLLDAHEYENYIHLNAFSEMDMW